MDGPASDALGSEVLAAMGVTVGAEGGGLAAAGGGVGGWPMNLGAAANAGVKMGAKSVALGSAGGLYESDARDCLVPSGSISTGGTCDLPFSAAVGLWSAVGAAEWLVLRA